MNRADSEGPAALSGRGPVRVAFFGGSFDPPHLGHLAVARAAQAGLRLDRVLFAPVGAQPLKPEGSTASFENRVEMTRLAIAGEEGFEISLADAPKRICGRDVRRTTWVTAGREELDCRRRVGQGSRPHCTRGQTNRDGEKLVRRRRVGQGRRPHRRRGQTSRGREKLDRRRRVGQGRRPHRTPG